MPNKPLVSGKGARSTSTSQVGDQLAIPVTWHVTTAEPSTGDPATAELAIAARACAPLATAKKLAAWVGEGRPVTTARVLASPAAAEAIRVLGLRPPLDDPELDARQEAMFLVPDRDTGDRARRSTELSRVWDLALDVGFLSVAADVVAAGPAVDRWPAGTDNEVLDVWAVALASASRRAYDHEQVRLPEQLCQGALPALEPLSGASEVSLLELRVRLAQQAARQGLADELQTWIDRFGDPLAPLLACLIELGAVRLSGERASITPLGTWAWSNMAGQEG